MSRRTGWQRFVPGLYPIFSFVMVIWVMYWHTMTVTVKTDPLRPARKIALCYIRQSMTRNPKDSLSPKRQHDYIQKYLDTSPDLEPLWFSDDEGHRSGRHEKGRPEFQNLLDELLMNPDVAELIVTEFARLARSVFTSAKMIEMLRERDIRLIFANTQEVADLQSAAGRMTLHFQSAMNEWYSDYVSMMQFIAIAAKRAAGKWVGGLPFATYQRQGILRLDRRNGAWWFPDGSFLAGKADKPPTPDAVFRPYEGTLTETYAHYALGIGGAEAVAWSLNCDGWPFQDQAGQPCPVTHEHVRTMLAEWPIYGGYYLAGRAKERAGYREIDPDSIPLNAKRALLDPGLIRLVAETRKDRGKEPTPDHGIRMEATALPLAQLTRCARCEEIAERLKDAHRRTRLGSEKKRADDSYYRHRGDVRCGCHARAVKREVLEQDFVDLLRHLEARPAAFADLLGEAQCADEQAQAARRALPDPERVRRHQRDRYQEKLRRLDRQFGEVIISEQTYESQKAEILDQLRQWETPVIEDEVVDLTLENFLKVLRNPAALWPLMEMEGQRALAHGLFDYLLYDLDGLYFTRWQLSAWADSLFILDYSPSEKQRLPRRS